MTVARDDARPREVALEEVSPRCRVVLVTEAVAIGVFLGPILGLAAHLSGLWQQVLRVGAPRWIGNTVGWPTFKVLAPFLAGTAGVSLIYLALLLQTSGWLKAPRLGCFWFLGGFFWCAVLLAAL
jgi:hypothetical protein